MGELRERFEFVHFAVQARGVSQPHCPGHLPGGRRDVGGDVEHLGLVLPRAIGVDVARDKMPDHRASAGGGIMLHVGMGVKLGKILLDVDHAEGEHPGLVAVVARAPVAFAEGAGDGHLGDFLAVAKDAEFGFSAQHFAPPNQRHLPRLVGGAVIFDDFIGG